MPRSTRRPTQLPQRGHHGPWKLEDAKARFSELVRLARSRGPQRVTVRGQDAVVVVAAEHYATLVPSARQPSLHALLSSSPLRHVKVPARGQPMPVRDIRL